MCSSLITEYRLHDGTVNTVGTKRYATCNIGAMRNLLLFLAASVAAAQSFEVASVKLAVEMPGTAFRPTGVTGGPGTSSPGQTVAKGLSLTRIIQHAYNLSSYQLSAPEWMDSAQFDVVAKVPEGASRADVSVMWQHLLAERFKLAVHKETRDVPMHALVVAKGGPKIKPIIDDDAHKNDRGNAGFTVQNGIMHLYADKETTSQLAGFIATLLKHPVTNATGLTYQFKLALDFQRDELAAIGGEPGPSIFAAVEEQLGLKLEPRKGPSEVLVVEHAEKMPTGN
jgi:uncharacterized protein (TIGR03435 family)